MKEPIVILRTLFNKDANYVCKILSENYPYYFETANRDGWVVQLQFETPQVEIIREMQIFARGVKATI